MSDHPRCAGAFAVLVGADTPTTGAWCRACHGTRWWTERHGPKGWRCLTCHPPAHLPASAIPREGDEPQLSADRLFELVARGPDRR